MTRLAVEVEVTVQKRVERMGFLDVYVRFVAAQEEEEKEDVMVLLGGWSGRDVGEKEGNGK